MEDQAPINIEKNNGLNLSVDESQFVKESVFLYNHEAPFIGKQVNDQTANGIMAFRKVVDELNKDSDIGLFRWKDFPIKLPEQQLLAGQHTINLASLFRQPSGSEVHSLGFDQSGRRKRLSLQQLDEIRTNGKFNVPSKEFEGKNHVWQLSPLLQMGKNVLLDMWQQGIANSLYPMVVAAPRSLSKLYLLTDAMWHTVGTIPDLLIGMPRNVPMYNTDAELRKKYKQFFLEDLEEDASQKFVFHPKRDALVRTNNNNSTNSNFDRLDFRLEDHELLYKVNSVLATINEKQSNSWLLEFVELRNQKTEALRQADPGMTDEELQLKVADLMVDIRHQRYFDAVMNSQQLAKLGPGLGSRIVQHLKACWILLKIKHMQAVKCEEKRQSEMKKLKSQHPILSRLSEWLTDKMAAIMGPFEQRQRDEFNKLAMEQLAAEGCFEEVYIIEKRTAFKKFEPNIIAEIEKQRRPQLVFEFNFQIWRPTHWIITKHDTRVMQLKGTRPYYTAQKFVTRKVTTRYPFWRLGNIVLRTWSWWNNVLFYVLAANMYAGPLGIRALVSPRDFYPASKLDRNTGTLQTDMDIRIRSFLNRLLDIWNHVQKSIADFESKPDSGILSKSVTRVFNRIWNYGLKLIPMMAATIVGIPIATVLNVVLSTTIGVTSIAWAPISAVLHYLFNALVFDTDAKQPGFLGNVLICFLFTLAAVLAVIFAALSPVMGLVGSLLVSGLYGIRSTYDLLLFNLIIKPLGRIPVAGNFLAKRIQGPGLASKHFLHMDSSVALLCLHHRMELHELRAIERFLADKINEPTNRLHEFTRKIFPLISANFDQNNRTAQQITRQTHLLQQDLAERVANWHKRHAIKGSVANRSVRLSSSELNKCLQQGIPLVRQFHEKRIFPRMKEGQIDKFWAYRGLMNNDWEQLCKALLMESIHSDILNPMEESDDYFSLSIHSLDATTYANMLIHALPRDHLERYSSVIVPSQKKPVESETPSVHMGTYHGSAQDERLIGCQFIDEHEVKMFVAQSLTVVGSASDDGHGIAIELVGSKQSQFSPQAAILTIEGQELWDALENILPTAIMYTFRNMLYPIDVSSQFNSETIPENITTAKVVARFGQDKPAKFQTANLIAKLQDIADKHNNPRFSLTIRYGNKDYGPFMESGVLVSVSTSAAELVQAIKTKQSLPIIQQH